MKKLKPGKDHIGVGGGILILDKNNKRTLLLKRGAKSKNEIGLWQKPGGTVDYGERVVSAMTREIKEEIGVGVVVWGYLPHTDHIIKRDGQHWVAFNLIAHIKSGRPKIMESEKHEKMEWFDLNKLPKATNQTTIESVKNYLAGKYIKLK